MRVRIAALAAVLSVIQLAAIAAGVDFTSRPLLAWRASVSGAGFREIRILGTANLSLELRFPIQLVYDSSSERTGIAGFGWALPQLESRVFWDKDGMLWTAPWGESLKFFKKKNPDRGKSGISVPFF